MEFHGVVLSPNKKTGPPTSSSWKKGGFVGFVLIATGCLNGHLFVRPGKIEFIHLFSNAARNTSKYKLCFFLGSGGSCFCFQKQAASKDAKIKRTFA